LLHHPHTMTAASAAFAERPGHYRSRLGRPSKTELRSVVNALLYMVRTGCQWRQLPREFPPYTTVQHYFYAWRDSGVLERINFELLLQAREAVKREPSPSAGVIDSQSVKTTEAGGPHGFDAAKINQRPQASYRHRHNRPVGRSRGASRRRARPTRRSGTGRASALRRFQARSGASRPRASFGLSGGSSERLLARGKLLMLMPSQSARLDGKSLITVTRRKPQTL
jgi:transposase